MRTTLLISFLSAWLCSGAQMVRFEKVFGAWSMENAEAAVQTWDGGYVIVGSTSSYGNGTTELYLLKIDSMGNFRWHRTFGDVNVDAGMSLVEAADSGLVCAGYTNSFGNGGYDVWIMKTDSLGNLLWSKTVGGPDWDFGNHIASTSDGGYIIAGSTFSFGNGDEDMYIIKTDANGDTLWTRAYGGNQEDVANEIVQFPGGSYLITGNTRSFGSGGLDVITMRISGSGDTLGGTGWHRIFGGAQDDAGNSIVNSLLPGEFMIGASTFSMGPADCNFLFIRYDTSGNLTSQVVNGTNTFEEINSIALRPDGGYILTGRKNFSSGGQFGIHLEKTNLSGWAIWGRDFGSLEDENGKHVLVCNDNGFLITGTTWSYGNGLQDIYVIKCDTLGWSSGTVVTGVTSVRDNSLPCYVFPTVFTGSFSLFSHDGSGFADHLFSLRDITGREIGFSYEMNGAMMKFTPKTAGSQVIFLNVMKDGQTFVYRLISMQ